MPRNAQNVYQIPPNTYGVSGQVISSVQYNGLIDDLVLDANSARPISVGGTGATTAAAARAALSVPSIADLNSLSGTVTGLGNDKLDKSGGTLTGALIGTTAQFSTFTGNLIGSAQTLTTARTFSFTGGATGSGSFNGSANVAVALTVSPTGHQHAQSQVTGLVSALADKAALVHGHGLNDVAGLVTALGGKASVASVNLKANLASPAFTGNPTAPTQTAGNNSTRIATTAYVLTALANTGSGDMLKAIYDPNDDGKVVSAQTADAAPWGGITGKPSTFTPSAHNHTMAQITGLTGALNGKLDTTAAAATAARWTTSRTLSLTGDAAGTVTFNGSANMSLSVAIADDSHNHIIANVDGLQAALNAKLASGATAVAASRLSTARTISLGGDLSGSTTFDGSSNVSIVAAVANNSHTHTQANVSGLTAALAGKLSTTGNAATASRWATARTITLTGDVSGSASIRGDANVTMNVNVLNNSHAHTIANVTGLQTSLNAKEATLNANQKRAITYGTAAPGALATGAIYIQHEA